MDKTAIERDLARVEHHVRQGEQIIARQRDIITGLERGGHDTAQAKTLLGQLEETQALHVGHRERLRRQLVDFDPFNVREVREPTSWTTLVGVVDELPFTEFEGVASMRISDVPGCVASSH